MKCHISNKAALLGGFVGFRAIRTIYYAYFLASIIIFSSKRL